MALVRVTVWLGVPGRKPLYTGRAEQAKRSRVQRAASLRERSPKLEQVGRRLTGAPVINLKSPTGPRELTHRSLWLQEALATEDAETAARERVNGRARADVCILGGGYTGLWTSLFLKEREPGLDVAIVEADICGGGASGRNGGFALSWWSKLATLIKQCGEDDGLWLAEQSEEAVAYLGAFCEENAIDCDFRADGWLWVASSEAQVDGWASTAEECSSRGLEIFEPLSADEAQRRGGSARFLGGIFDRTSARVQPAQLARGLRRVARERGVRIYENSPATAVEGTVPLVVRTEAGEIAADTVVSALNAWTPSLPQFKAFRRAVVVIASDIVATEPRPDLLEQSGLTGGEVVSDSRLMVHYHRTTPDGRMAFGKGGGAMSAAGYFGDNFHYDRGRAELTARHLRWLYPEFADVGITHAWSGPVDRTENGLPFFGRHEDRENLVYGLGFSGNGVAPCVNAGRVLASLALGEEDRWTQSALARGPQALFPPEPIRFLGGSIVRNAIRRKERYEDEGRKAPGLLTYLAGFAPETYFTLGPTKVVEPPPQEERELTRTK